MFSHRSTAWSAAVRELKADCAARPDIREERMRCTAGLRSNPPVALSAWRGHSGRRYVVRVEDLTLDTLDEAGNAVCIAVARGETGIASIVAAESRMSRSISVEWLRAVHHAGANELHIHRLAETDSDRAAVVADLTASSAVIDAVSDALDVMLTVYAVPGTWTQGCSARDEAGVPVPANDPRAVSWDIGGVIDLMVGEDVALGDLIENRLFDALPVSFSAFNDDASTTLANVVALLSCARDRVAA